jgi:hypothetical protein
MSAHRHRAYWRSLTFNRRYLDTGVQPDPEAVANINTAYVHDDYTLDVMNPTPLSLVDLREARQFLEGAEPNQAFEGSRLIELSGRIIAPSHGALEDKTAAMYEAFSPAACRTEFAALDPPHVGTFVFARDTAAATLALRAYCRPAIGRPVVFGRRGEGTTRRYLARLIAYDPKFYSQTEVSTALSNLVGGNNSIDAGGVLATDPKFVILLGGAGHAAFTLTNTSTGHAIVFNLSTLGVGMYTLDVMRSTFTKSDGTNVLSTRVSGFPTNMWLKPGTNVLTVTGNTNLTSVSVVRRAAYA